MKKYFLLIILTPFLTFSQTENDKIIYLDSIQNETLQGNHQFSRIIREYYLTKENYKINEYYKSGVLKLEGLTSKKNLVERVGEFIYYYENGNKKKTLNYTKDLPEGQITEWYENGKIKLEGVNIADEKKFSYTTKVNQYWNSTNIHLVVDGNGSYEEREEGFYCSGSVKNGFKIGQWKGYDKKTKSTFIETYENEKLISGISTDEKKTIHNYTDLFKRPEPKNGIEDFYKFIARNFNTPNIPINKAGKILIQFIVDPNGQIIEPKIIKSIGYGADEEAIRVLLKYPEWISGENRGIKVRYKYVIPITVQSIDLD